MIVQTGCDAENIQQNENNQNVHGSTASKQGLLKKRSVRTNRLCGSKCRLLVKEISGISWQILLRTRSSEENGFPNILWLRFLRKLVLLPELDKRSRTNSELWRALLSKRLLEIRLCSKASWDWWLLVQNLERFQARETYEQYARSVAIYILISKAAIQFSQTMVIFWRTHGSMYLIEHVWALHPDLWWFRFEEKYFFII